jgi:O-antigen/teichoic acid export membrane protein
VTTIVVKTVVFTAISLILLTPEFYHILAPKDGYADGLYATAPLIIASLFAFLYTIVAGVNLECAKPSRIACSTLLSALFGILLTLPAVQKFGFLGASFATAISYIVLTLVHSRLLVKVAGKDTLPLSPTSTTLLALSLLPTAFVTLILREHLFLRLLLLAVPLLLLLDLALRSRSLLEEK